jgi:dienelactone hydrolase
VIQDYFHRWEHELAAVSQADRTVRPFDWGEDWIDQGSGEAAPRSPIPDPRSLVSAWVDSIMRDTDAFFTPQPTRYTLTGDVLTFSSGFTTPHVENNTVVCRYFRPDPIRKPKPRSPRRAVVVIAQWNADPDGHFGLCGLLAKLGIASLRITLPYHDSRKPPGMKRAEYIVSANVVRTLQVCRQAVGDLRLALWWLRDQGYDRLGLLGTSLGSCLAYLTTCHEPLVKAQALNHVSPFFSDVVWRGLSTEHVREGLAQHLDADQLRELWRPINPWSYLDRQHDTQTLMVYAKYDLTFPVDLSRQLIEEFQKRRHPLKVRVLPCGHYSTGRSPFKFLDAWYLTRFLSKNL